MILETERLIIRLATFGDAHFFLKLLNQPSYIRNIRDTNVRSVEDARKFIEEFYFKSYQVNGFGLYVLQLKENTEIVGVCGLVKRDQFDFPDLGFALLSSYQGHGYIHESSLAVLDYAGTTLDLDELGAITVPGNSRSVNLLTKLGFKFEKKIELSLSQKELMLYKKKLNQHHP